MKIHNRRYLKTIRKKLRNNLTSAEATLWKFLQGSKLEGRKFRRQHSVGHYILDFYCPQENLAIEIDGDGHFTSAGFEKDQERENYLQNLNIRVLRFGNDEVFQATETVFGMIKAVFTTPPVGTPPKIGGDCEASSLTIFFRLFFSKLLKNPVYKKPELKKNKISSGAGKSQTLAMQTDERRNSLPFQGGCRRRGG